MGRLNYGPYIFDQKVNIILGWLLSADDATPCNFRKVLNCIFDSLLFQGILSSVYIDGRPLSKWRMLAVPLHNLNEDQKINSIVPNVHANILKAPARSARKKLKNKISKFETIKKS